MTEGLKERILEGTIQACRKKGMKFTMDDVASELSISKKTIYTVFPDKVTLMEAMTDYVFDRVNDEQTAVIKDGSIDTVEKMRRVLTVMPDIFSGVEFSDVYSLKEKFPKLYDKVMKRLQSGWEMTFRILDMGIEEGVFRKTDHRVFELIYEAALEKFLYSDRLHQMDISYTKAQNELVDILIYGIKR